MQRGFGYQNRRNAGFNPATLFAGGTVQGAWYDPSDSTTLFSDRAGTTPCGTPGGGSVVPVGLMLDKSQGLVLGSELVTNGGPGFTTTTGWGVFNATVTASGGKLVCAKTAPLPAVFWTLTTVVGTWYKVDIVWENVDATSPRILVNSSGGLSITTTNTTATVYFLAVAASTFVQMELGNGSNGTGTRIISLSAKTVSGNHAIAANDTTARPELSARVNLLTYSEQFDNAAWTKQTGVSITPNTDIAPDGTLTADTLNSTLGNQTQIDVACAANTLYTDSICFKKTSGATYQPALYLLFYGGTTVIYAVRLNTDTGVGAAATIGGFTTPTSFSVTDLGAYWRLSITGNSNNNTTGRLAVYPNWSASGAVAAGSQIIWGAQLTATNEFPANTYQRISDANTYDAVGFPRYLVANGTSSIMTVPGSASAMKFLHSDVSSVCIAANVGASTNPNATYSFFGTNGGATAQIGVWSAYDDQAAGSNNNALRNLTTGGTAGQPVINTADQNSIPPLASNVIFYNSNPANATPASRYTAYINNGSALATNASGQARSTANSSKDMELFATGDGTPGGALGLMNFYGLIIVNATITGGQRTATQNWIAAKMGVTLP